MTKMGQNYSRLQQESKTGRQIRVFATCSRRCEGCREAIAKLSRNFPGAFCWYKIASANFLPLFCTNKKLLESSWKAPRKALVKAFGKVVLRCEHVCEHAKILPFSIPVATSCTKLSSTQPTEFEKLTLKMGKTVEL